MSPSKILFGLSCWDGDADGWVLEAGQCLQAVGWEVGILFTAGGTRGVTQTVSGPALPRNLACEDLPQSPTDDWEARWDALIRYLELAAPCVYVMSTDVRCNVIAPRLSDSVLLVGLVRAGCDEDLDQALRLGMYWNLVVTFSQVDQFRLARQSPALAPRIVRIDRDDSTGRLERALTRARALSGRGWYRRPVGQVRPSPGVDVHPCTINQTPVWPRPAGRQGRLPSLPASHSTPANRPLKTIFALPGGQISGVDIFTANLVRELARRGLPTRIVGSRKTWGRMGLALERDLPLDDLGEWYGLPEQVAFRCLRAYLESHAPCIFVPNYLPLRSSLLGTLSRDIRLVGICHSDDPWHYAHLMQIGSRCDAIVGVSQAIVEHLARLNPESRDRLSVIPYGVHVGTRTGRRQPGEPLRILFSGRLVSYQKRARDLVEIASLLADQHVPFQLDLVGDGELFRPLADLVLERGLQDRVSLRGKWSNGELLERLADYDAYLLTSSFEGLPVGMLEAMGSGLVPVVSRIRSGIPELIEQGKTGFTARVGDLEGFARHLKTLQADAARQESMGAQARAIVASGYTVRIMADRYIHLFEQIANRPPPKCRLSWQKTWLTALSRLRDFAHSWG